MLGITALFAALCVPGFLLGRLFEKASEGSSVGLILQYVAMPALVFSSLSGPLPETVRAEKLAVSALMPAVLAAILFLVTAFVFPKEKDGARRSALRVCAIFPNCGFFGIPLAAALFPDQPEVKLEVAVFNVVSTVIYLTFGACLMGGKRDRRETAKSLLEAPVLWAAALGIAVSLTGLSERLGFLGSYSDLLSGLCTPLAMIGLGMSVAHRRVKPDAGMFRAALVRLLLSPLIAVALTLPFSSRSLTDAMLISAGVCTAGSVPALIGRYGGDGGYAAVCTFLNTALSVLTLPLLYGLSTLLPL